MSASKKLEKISKYKDLEIDITRLRGIKVTTMPVVIGALGLIKKELEKRILKKPGTPVTRELQKIVLLESAHIIRKTLSIS